MKLKYKLENDSIIGIRNPEIKNDVGYDLYAKEDSVVKSNDFALIKTGVFLQLPRKKWAEIMPKSGLAFKYGITVHNGVIDNGYRGEIIIKVMNLSKSNFEFKKNKKIAQLVIRKSICPKLLLIKKINKSKRGNKGFGSTGN